MEVLFYLPDEAPFFFAGLWGNDPIGKHRGFSFVTTKPNKVVAALPHDRMPLILNNEGADLWLSGRPLSADDLGKICVPWPDDQLVAQAMPQPTRKTKKSGSSELCLGLPNNELGKPPTKIGGVTCD